MKKIWETIKKHIRLLLIIIAIIVLIGLLHSFGYFGINISKAEDPSISLIIQEIKIEETTDKSTEALTEYVETKIKGELPAVDPLDDKIKKETYGRIESTYTSYATSSLHKLKLDSHEYSVDEDDPVITLHMDGKINGFYTLSPFEDHPARSAIIDFYGWNGQWILEFDDRVIVSGRDVGRTLGYSKVFNYSVLANRTFFFFKKGIIFGKYGFCFNGVEYKQRYEDIVHYECCEPALLNFDLYNNKARFYAYKNGAWYYVYLEANCLKK